jgi:molecular chaperone GrpE
VLRRLDVVEVPCLGKPFDPAVMRAVDVAETTSGAVGTVVEVFRPGYVVNGRVIRYAEVKVAGARSGERTTPA